MDDRTPSRKNRKENRKAYKLGYKKKNVPLWVKRILISWLVCLFIGGAIGSGLTAIAIHSRGAADTNKDMPYGTRDGRIFTEEMSRDWSGDLEFIPLDCALPVELQEFTYYLSTGYYIDFSYVMGLMFCESSFRTDCVSGTDDYGLMQINKQNHKWLSEQLGLDDITDPYQNIRAGLFILRQLFEKYDDPAKVAMAYNMGEYGASVLWEQGIYETSYSKKVLAKADEYKEQLENSIKK